ncbi:MAG: nitroreductase family protein [Bacillota bacterium]
MEQIKTRRSIRRYLDKPVEDEKIKQIIESARLAPSGNNTQPWHFIIVKSAPVKEKLAEIAQRQKWMLTAPVFIVCVADIRVRLKNDAEIILDENSPQYELKQIIRDTAIAVEHMVLEAESMGLSTCWVAWFKQADIRPVLNIPADKYVVSILTLGYAGESPAARPRKKLEEIIHYEKW